MRIRHHISDFLCRNEAIALSVVETAFDRLGKVLNGFFHEFVHLRPSPSLSFGDWREHDCDAAIIHGSTIPQVRLAPAGVEVFGGEATYLSNCKDHVSTIAQTTKYQGLQREGRQGTAGF